jgi:hypothetical protein
MASLSKVVRPYLSDFSGLQSLFDEVTVDLGGEQIPAGRTAVRTSEQDFLSQRIAVKFPFETSELRQCPLLRSALELAEHSFEDVELVVTSTSRGLRRSDALFRRRLSEAEVPLEGMIIQPDARPASLRSPHSGSIIEVQLLLAEERTPSFGVPFRKGTWLARSEFGIGTRTAGRGFEVLALSDRDRDRFGLGSQTHWYVDVTGEAQDLLEVGSLADCVNVYVDQELLNRIKVNDGTPDSRLIQSIIAMDVFQALTSEFIRLSSDEVPPTALEGTRFYELLAFRNGGGQLTEEHLSQARERLFSSQGPEGFIADLAHSLNMKKLAYDALENAQ